MVGGWVCGRVGWDSRGHNTGDARGAWREGCTGSGHHTPSSPQNASHHPHPMPLRLPSPQVWEKLTNYMEIEARSVPNRPGTFIASNEDLMAACDENTIGVCGREVYACACARGSV